MSKELKGKADSALEKELLEQRTALRTFRFGSAGSKTRNVREGRNLRRNVAQILTELNERRRQS